MRDRLQMLKAAQGEQNESTDSIVILVEQPTWFINEFFADVAEIREMNRNILNYTEEVKKLHRAILCSPQTNEKTEKELENLMTDIQKTANLVQNRIKVIDREIEQIEEDPNSAAVRIQKTQYAMLVREFSDVMIEYNRTQVDYRERCKNRIRRQLKIAGRRTTKEDIEQMLEDGNPSVFTQGIIVATKEEKDSLADIEARHADIMKLETSIKGLHDMFMDMAFLVESQGEMVDRIENNVGQAVICIRKAEEETKKAGQFNTKALQKKLLLSSIAVIILIMFIIIICRVK